MKYLSNEQDMSSMRNFIVIFQTVFKEAVKTKAYVYMTISLVLLSLVIVIAPHFLQKIQTNTNDETFIFVDEANIGISDELFQNALGNWEVKAKADVEELQEQVKEEEISGLFVFENKYELDVYMLKKDNEVILAVQALVEQQRMESELMNSQLEQDVIVDLLVPVQSNIVQLYDVEANGNVLIFGLISILFLAISTYGNNVATSIASEKSSRVMEVMITKVSPISMMFGKILGIGFASLCQLFIFIGSFFIWIALKIVPISDQSFAKMMVDLITFEAAIYILLLFIIGYFIYATLFAIIGSMVSRPDELSSATIPVVIILLVSLVIEMVFVIDYPAGRFASITTYIPFTAPISLLIRIVYQTVTLWETFFAMIVMVLFVGLFATIAAKIYRKGMLKSDNMTLKQLFK